MSALADREIVAAAAGTPPMSTAEIAKYRPLVGAGWSVSLAGSASCLTRHIATADFAEAMSLANRIASLAQQVSHHPELTIACGGLTITLWTHSSGGLTGNDFIFAAKADRLLAA